MTKKKVKEAEDTVKRVIKSGKSFARKIQILTVMEQRAKVMGKKAVVEVAKRAKERLRRERDAVSTK